MEKAKKARTSLRQTTTKLINKLELELKRTREELNLDAISEHLAKLEAKEIALLKLDNEIESLCEVEALDEEINSRENYNENIIAWKVRANRILNSRNTLGRLDTREQTIIKSNTNTPQILINLPKLEIKPFGGNILKFTEFWQQFQSAIDNNASLSDVEKFNYLKSYLIRDAEDAVRGLALTAENYKSAVEILKGRFGKKDLIIDAHISRLLSISPVFNANDISQLRKLHHECQIQCRGLKNIGIDVDDYSKILCPVLMKTMPKCLALEFTRINYNHEDIKVSDILSYLEKEIGCRERHSYLMRGSAKYDASNNDLFPKHENERGKFTKGYTNNNSKLEYDKRKNKENIASAAMFCANTKGENKGCVFCIIRGKEKTHESQDCSLNTHDKRVSLIKQKRCFRCLCKGHRVVDCLKTDVCINGKAHHTLICDCLELNSSKVVGGKSYKNAKINSTNDREHANFSNVCTTHSHTKDDGREKIYLQTLRGKIVNDQRSMNVRILCDFGSNRSFCLRKCAEQLQLPIIAQENIKVFSFGKNDAELEVKNKIRMTIQNPFNQEQQLGLEAILTDVITTATIPVPSKAIERKCCRKGIRLSEKSNSVGQNQDIDVLIGSDYIWKLFTGRVKRLSSRLVAVETLFGYCLSGTQEFYSGNVVTLHVNAECRLKEHNNLTEQIRKFWELDSMGIRDDSVKTQDKNNHIWETFKDNVKFKDSRYQVKLPWNMRVQGLGTNIAVAKSRLNSLLLKFNSNEEFYNEYRNILKEQLEMGIIEKVFNDTENVNKAYYMPHHGVIREDKVTTKLRIVYDCSSHSKGYYSLNDCLFAGPNLNPNLLNIILKFRVHKIAFVADIEKAFLMISIDDEDRNCLRFLWVENIYDKPLKVTTYRMTRVTFGVSCSPFLLAATLKYHIETFKTSHARAVSMLDNDLYVDDLVSGSDNLVDAYQSSEEAKFILAKAGMNLRKWQSNSKELKQQWLNHGFEVSNDKINDTSMLKVLGITWNSELDIFKLELSKVLKLIEEPIYTKRKVLQVMSSIFDPIGFISPFLIKFKIFIQDLWERGFKWDEELDVESVKKCKKWYSEIPELSKLKVPRMYFENICLEKQKYEFHIFCDASEVAFGAVAYLRCTFKEKTYTSFVMSKSRVAPVKRLTLPRLELLGAVVAARLAKYLREAFKISKEYQFIWSDSTIVLSWVRSHSKDWKSFVSNRVQEIQELTDTKNWKYCKGKDNPADILTRGCSVEKLLLNEKGWWKGPSWLECDEINTLEINIKPSVENILKETKIPKHMEVVQMLNHTMIVENLFNIERYSSMIKVLRITAWIFRFIRRTQGKTSASHKALLSEELKEAENFWIGTVQMEHFGREIEALRKKESISKKSKIYIFNPFLDTENILRVGGRLQNSKFDFQRKHPIILPSYSHFTQLVIEQCHTQMGHAGIADTILQIRERFWILKCRQRVKSFVNGCLICRRFRVKPVVQDIAPLPPDRVEETNPFEVCGIDFAGPLYVKYEHEKSYIALFTCATTRAVHLELVSDLTTEKFILAFRRFVARRGLCKKIYSDNAKTFKKAEKDIKEIYALIEDPAILDYIGNKGIKWQYIVEKAAWWGGFWERLVKTTKICLMKILWKALLTFEELQTVLTEVEAIINSRPLTYVCSDDQEAEVLTPSHFLIGRRLTSLPSGTLDVVNSKTGDLTKRFKYKQGMIEKIWNTWKNSYLLELRSAHECAPKKEARNLKEGDIVSINEGNKPRLTWKTGVIVESHIGRDGKVRACTIRLPNRSLIKRPVQLLYPSELSVSKTNFILAGPQDVTANCNRAQKRA